LSKWYLVLGTLEANQMVLSVRASGKFPAERRLFHAGGVPGFFPAARESHV
jgi:hypothetical protein